MRPFLWRYEVANSLHPIQQPSNHCITRCAAGKLVKVYGKRCPFGTAVMMKRRSKYVCAPPLSFET
jgi:hypothetical protein